MLSSLFVEHVALIDKLDIEFRKGFNVLTGETGAGKSIIIDAVNFVLGERASKDIIKHGEQKARVEALFTIESPSSLLLHILNANELELDEGTLTLSRELSQSGKNVCRVNGTLTNIATLKQISDHLIDIHGQHEHQSLLMQERHIDFLDSFIGAEASAIKNELGALAHEHRAIVKESLSGFVSEDERAREIDILSYQINEIEAAALGEDEDAALESELTLLANAEKINSSVEGAYEALSGEEYSALSQIKAAEQLVIGIAEFSDEFDKLSKVISDSYYNLEDASRTLREMCETYEFDQSRLDAVETRLDVIAGLKKKYGGSIAAIHEFASRAKKRLDELVSADARREQLSKKRASVEKKYYAAAKKLSDIRREKAKLLEMRIKEELCDLGLAKAAFCASVTDLTGNELFASGLDRVEFMLSANPGEPLKPLSKVASGGELSRIMLAFKAVLAGNDGIGTLIFDEIDTGISGKVAGTVGEKMFDIACLRQVICITHLPQIAALGDVHFAVSKSDDGNTTNVNVEKLDINGRYARIAQMMDGGLTELSLTHAKELVDRLDAQKTQKNKA